MKKFFKKIFVVFLLATLSSCVSQATDRFCQNSSYVKDTPEYKGCYERNYGRRDEIWYCEEHYGIIKEGSKARECFAEARNMEKEFNKDDEICNLEAKDKYPYGEMRSITPTQKFTYNESGQLSEVKTITQEEVPNTEIDAKRNNYRKLCMKKRNWGDYGFWRQQKKL